MRASCCRLTTPTKYELERSVGDRDTDRVLSLSLAKLSLTQHGGLAAMTAFALVCSAAVLLPVPAPALRRVRPGAMLQRTSPVMVEGLVDRPIRYAVLVDAENTQHSRMELVMEELAKYGTTSIRFVYGTSRNSRCARGDPSLWTCPFGQSTPSASRLVKAHPTLR